MSKGPKKGSKQHPEHIRKRVNNRTKWNGGHNLLTTETFLKKLSERWPDCPYDLSKVSYVKNTTKITLVCEVHGDFIKWPSDVLNHSGCPKCAGHGKTKEEHIMELSIKFSEYDFSVSVYKNAVTNMDIICKKHGKFSLSRNALLNGGSCINCTKDRILKERIEAGRARDPATLTEFERYKREVWKETNKTYRIYKEVLGTRSRIRHLDHIYSILHGFNNNISPVIIGNIVNLRIIDAKQNQSKNTDSHYTKEELIMLYEQKTK
jgi:hypothetical protein